MTTAQNNHCIEKAAEHAFTCQDQMRSMAVNHACTLALARVFGQWQGCVPRAMNAKASALLRLQRIAVIHAEQQVTLARWWSWCARRKADSASRQHQMLLVVCRTVLRRAAMDGGWQRWKQRLRLRQTRSAAFSLLEHVHLALRLQGALLRLARHGARRRRVKGKQRSEHLNAHLAQLECLGSWRRARAVRHTRRQVIAHKQQVQQQRRWTAEALGNQRRINALNYGVRSFETYVVRCRVARLTQSLETLHTHNIVQTTRAVYNEAAVRKAAGLLALTRNRLYRHKEVAKAAVQWCSVSWGSQTLVHWAKVGMLRAFHMWCIAVIRLWAVERAEVASTMAPASRSLLQLDSSLLPSDLSPTLPDAVLQDLHRGAAVMKDFEAQLLHERQQNHALVEQLSDMKMLGGEEALSNFDLFLAPPRRSEHTTRSDFLLTNGPESSRINPLLPKLSPKLLSTRAPHHQLPARDDVNSLTDDLEEMQRNLRSMMF